MKGVVFMARDPKKPVTFNLTDNDSVSLIPWAYVVDKFETILTDVIDNLSAMDTDIGRINTKLQSWIDGQD